nr:nitrate reductase [uncultured Cohaesibacter sp.]
MENVTRTTCPYCGVGCGVLIEKHPDGSVRVKGDPDHPANFGRLCSKGTALGDTVGLEERLLYPEINGERASWDNALDTIADRFKQIIAEDGPDAIAFYVSGQILTEDYYAANKLMKGVIGSANIDTNSRLCMASSVAGHKRAFGADTVPGCYEDLELADLIVLTGTNLAWCHPVLYQRIVQAKKGNPKLKVVLIDPRRTMTADIADLHLPISPDGDIALFLGLLAEISRSDQFDANYVGAYTNGMEDAVASACSLSQKEIMSQTGLTEAELKTFYELFVSNEKVVTIYSQGVNQSRVGSNKVNAIINCHLATGRIGRPGMGPFSVTGQPNAMGGREVGGLANMLACHMDIENPSHRRIVGEFWKSGTLPTEPGLKAIELFQAVADGKIRALWIMSTNPVVSMPDANAVRAAIQSCPLVIVSDVQAHTDTLDLAHIKLPAIAWGEKDGTVTNSERCISRQRSFLPAPGEAKADWWHMAEVGRRMGYGSLFDWQGPADIFREYAALSAEQNEGTRDFDIGAWRDKDEEAYGTMAPFQWPAIKGTTSTSNHRFFADGGFFTPDRKARAVKVTTDCALEAQATLPDHSFILNTGRVRDHWHTMTRTARSARLSAHLSEPYCEIHPEDAQELEIKNGDLVLVENALGSVIVRAAISDKIKQGQLFVPMHWTDQYSANARIDQLVPSIKDPVSGQPASKSAHVRISHASIGSFGFAVLRDKPENLTLPYWTLARSKDGWRLEFGLEENAGATSSKFIMTALGIASSTEPLVFLDRAKQRSRYAWFDGEHLVASVFLAKEPVTISRDFVSSLLAGNWSSFAQRAQVIAGVPGKETPDKGKIICACMNVGLNEITAAKAKGCCSVDAIGKATGAGTNCGSCKPEIAEMLHDVAAE